MNLEIPQVSEQEEKSELEAENRRETQRYIDMIETRWIPDAKGAIGEFTDDKKKSEFADELAKIEADFVALESADFSDKKIKETVQDVYKQAEGLCGRILEELEVAI